MGITPLSFTGVSSFSDDFQTILKRSVSIASIPLTGLQAQQADLLTKKQLLSGFQDAVEDLGAAVESLGQIGESKAIHATVSNSERVSVTVTGAVGAGTHSITEITSLAAAASATSLSGYATADSTAVSSGGTLELVVGDQRYTVDLTAAGQNNLNGLRDAINNLGAGVSATVLNTGSGQTPYYLSLTSESSGLKAFELRETAGQASTNLLTNQLPSANSVFTTNTGFATSNSTPVTSDGILELAAGGVLYAVDASGQNTLEGVRDVINGLGAGVQAEIVTDSGNQYRLQLTSATGSAVELRDTAGDTSSNLLTAAHQGANAAFKLDGLPVVKSDNVVSDVFPGLTFTLLSTTSANEVVAIALASGRSELSTALGTLATAYNRVVTLANAQIGKNAGLLSGDSIVREIQASLHDLTSYTTGGAIRNLADLGILLDDKGKMSFQSSTLSSLSNSDLSAAFTFLGSPTTGLGALVSSFNSISDHVDGTIALRQSQYDAADTRLSQQITEISTRVNLMQTTLSRQLQQADSLLATLESQQQMLDASIQGLNLTLYGRKES